MSWKRNGGSRHGARRSPIALAGSIVSGRCATNPNSTVRSNGSGPVDDAIDRAQQCALVAVDEVQRSAGGIDVTLGFTISQRGRSRIDHRCSKEFFPTVDSVGFSIGILADRA